MDSSDPKPPAECTLCRWTAVGILAGTSVYFYQLAWRIPLYRRPYMAVGVSSTLFAALTALIRDKK